MNSRIHFQSKYFSNSPCPLSARNQRQKGQLTQLRPEDLLLTIPSSSQLPLIPPVLSRTPFPNLVPIFRLDRRHFFSECRAASEWTAANGRPLRQAAPMAMKKARGLRIPQPILNQRQQRMTTSASTYGLRLSFAQIPRGSGISIKNQTNRGQSGLQKTSYIFKGKALEIVSKDVFYLRIPYIIQ